MTQTTTTIDYCEGIHQATQLPMYTLRDIRTELPEGYSDCPQEEQEAVLSALHRLEVARLEVASQINRAGRDGSAEVQAVLEDHSDALFEAAREDATTFAAVYEAATREIEALPRT